MNQSPRVFPPPRIADLDRQSAGNFLALLRDLAERPVTLILGAGVSASAGLPPWNLLLRGICSTFFSHWEWQAKGNARSLVSPPKNLSVALWEEIFWSDESKRAADQFVEQDALLVAQQIKNCIRDVDWRYMIRKLLYNYNLHGEPVVRESKLIQSLAKHSAECENLQSVISYNWDNLFERSLREFGVRLSPIWEAKQKCCPRSLPIYYPHGYLPLEGGPVTRLVFAENEYHQEATEPYSWANLIQIRAFCGSACVFIGTSMVDPNIRRLLDLGIGAAPLPNYAFLPSSVHRADFEVMSEALFDLDLSRLGVKTIRFPVDSALDDPYSRLPELIDLMRQDLVDKSAIWQEVDA
jgi:hypothetical protein